MSDRLAQVLAHPLRDRVLFEYQGEPTTPGHVARRLGRPVNLVSYHTRVLAEHGCLVLVRTERRRGAVEHFYRSAVAQRIADDEWEGVPAPLRRSLVLGTLRALGEEAREAALEGGFDARHAQLMRVVLELDDEGFAAASRVLRDAFFELDRIAAERRGRPGRRPVEVGLLAFAQAGEPPRGS